jgi:lysine 2,3-aminomutase
MNQSPSQGDRKESVLEDWEPPGPGFPTRPDRPPSRSPEGSLDCYPEPAAPRLELVSRIAPAATPAPAAFRRRHFPGLTAAQWNDWRWQVRNRVTTPAALGRFLKLTPGEEAAFASAQGRLPFGITPYYLSLISPDDPGDPLRKTVVPRAEESLLAEGESADPLGERTDTRVPGLVHRYPDRVLFLATGFCSTYCRYCTRSRMVGSAGELSRSRAQLQLAVDYVARHPQVRDVLISGGDPLTMADDRLDWLLGAIRAIPHVEIIRLGTKTPAVLPQRITTALVRVLRKHHPLFMSLHFTHPAELTSDAARACARLADAGVPLGSQTVLLAGINDDLSVMRGLCQGLLRLRVRPYYLYQCDPIQGSGHFRTRVGKGLEIIAGLRGHTTGYAVPTFVIDAPGGGGKVALCPESVAGRRGRELLLLSYDGGLYAYPDPAGPAAA